uniref:Uncharacterized protein n=1 Tax=Trichuris muris TaxID=70415 RepID=A0A5S6QD87_TRIMR
MTVNISPILIFHTCIILIIAHIVIYGAPSEATKIQEEHPSERTVNESDSISEDDLFNFDQERTLMESVIEDAMETVMDVLSIIESNANSSDANITDCLSQRLNPSSE